MLALGLVETMGLVPAIEAADAMLKAADVRLLEKNYADGGLVTITVAGGVSAVQASVEAGKACVSRFPGQALVSAHVIPRPDSGLASVLLLDPEKAFKKAEAAVATPAEEEDGEADEEPAQGQEQEISPMKQEAKAAPAEAAPAEARLKRMSLNRLRQMAWGMDGMSMTEEAIASADKKTLIAAILQAFRKVEE